ncbi:hypothetical protein [Demequina sp. SO4-18]|uniref:hypothetical protein n=1 Tax=Demequina sp. SO4-18 TaxID=3401026 RepID=UPI003B5BFFF8
MMMDLFLTASGLTLASSSDGDGAGWIGIALLILPFVVGWFLYRTMYKRYRNQDKRYEFETTTSAVRSNLRRWDTFVREHKRQRNREITGRNDDDPLQRAGHVAVEEVETARQAQEAREAQEPRLAQEPRTAQGERAEQTPRVAEGPRETQLPVREDPGRTDQ